MFDEQGLRDDHRRILNEIEMIRRPYLGIVSGYHELGYRVLGPGAKAQPGSVQISGRLMVSPKLIWTPAQARKTFGEMFSQSNTTLHKEPALNAGSRKSSTFGFINFDTL